MHAWVALYPVPVDDDEKRHMSLDYFRALCSMSPRKALQPLINKFCSLYYINCPPWAGTEHELVYEQSAFLLRDRADFSDKSEFEPLANLSFCRNVHEETSPGDGRGLCQLHFAAIWWAGDVQTVNQMILEHRNDCYTKKPRFPASSACR